MKLAVLLLLFAVVVTLPFAFIKQPWAIKLWRRIRLVILIYVIVVLSSAIVRLVLHWDDFYG